MMAMGIVLFCIISAFWTGNAEVVPDFKNCNEFFYSKQEPSGFIPRNGDGRYKRICQTLHNKRYFATLYDTKYRIPVYSAYLPDKPDGNKRPPRPNSRDWFYEPEFSNGSHEPNMMQKKDIRPEDMQNIIKNQAVDEDYKNSNYTRGHLSPYCHRNADSCMSTFTFTNMAPQVPSFNNGNWCKYEEYLNKTILPSCAVLFVVTGVIPSKDNFIKRRVNIPSHFWSAYYCQNSSMKRCSDAFIGRNTNDTNEVKTVTLNELQDKLKVHFEGREIRIFPALDNTILHCTTLYDTFMRACRTIYDTVYEVYRWVCNGIETVVKWVIYEASMLKA
ncbi:endonuclease domain-containing 1 protein-like isoform X2 [Protopterus annectens]|uniref:endonuclease domain-containing 1 protein-like isoform X2 n=1 Tax=Protopterus annectens TaxID=7888 RepID=UPI001CF93423|nr:endonuclease domain-containing 1 protein-like isoform X2 [Protopterus annectens]